MSDANGKNGANGGGSNGVNPEKDLSASNLPGQRGDGGEEIRVQRGMFGANNGGDTSGYGGLVRSIRLPGEAVRPYGGWFDEVADELEGALEEQGLVPENVIDKTVVDRGELTEADRRAYASYARAQMHKDAENVDVSFRDPETGEFRVVEEPGPRGRLER